MNRIAILCEPDGISLACVLLHKLGLIWASGRSLLDTMEFEYLRKYMEAEGKKCIALIVRESSGVTRCRGVDEVDVKRLLEYESAYEYDYINLEDFKVLAKRLLE